MWWEILQRSRWKWQSHVPVLDLELNVTVTSPNPHEEWGAVPALQPCLGAATLISGISFIHFFLSELRLMD